MLGFEVLWVPPGEPEPDDLPFVSGLLAQQIPVVLILTLETVSKRFGVDASHMISVA
jgi:hypothetical protein